MWPTGHNRWQYRAAITVFAVRELWKCLAGRQHGCLASLSLPALASFTVQLSVCIRFFLTVFRPQSFHHTLLYFSLYLLFLFLHSRNFFFICVPCFSSILSHNSLFL
jgi:hypothetical protein